MSSLSLTDDPELKIFMSHFSSIPAPSRRTLTRDLNETYERTRLNLINMLKSQKYLATTADSWTAHSRAFIGMTVHWINDTTLKREQATLACKEIKV